MTSEMDDPLVGATKPRPLCIIPARGGSKRIKGKNKRLLNGRPLVDYAIKAAIDSKLFELIVVSSDDEDILELAYDYFNVAPVHPNKRPKVFCKDDVPLKAVVRFVAMLYIVGNEMCLLQPTNPLITAKDIRKAYKKFKKTGANYLIGMCNGNDIGFHFFKKDVFLGEYDKDFYGTNWIPYEMKGVDIDTEEDFLMAQNILRERNNAEPR